MKVFAFLLHILDTLDRLSTMFKTVVTFMTSSFLSCIPGPFQGAYSKKKEFDPKGNKLFLLRVGPLFQKEGKNNLTELPALEVYPFPFK